MPWRHLATYHETGPAWTYTQEARAMMWPYGYGAGWGWMIGGWIMMIVIWGLVIVAIVALVRAASDRSVGAQPKGSEAPIEILRRRYAAGELTKEQFEEMKRDVA